MEDILKVENHRNSIKGLIAKVKQLSSEQGIEAPIPKKVKFNHKVMEEKKVYLKQVNRSDTESSSDSE